MDRTWAVGVGEPAMRPPTVAARSPTGQLNSTCHQDVGRVYLSGVYMYFNLNLCQPAQLTPAAPPTPTRRRAWPEKGTRRARPAPPASPSW